MMKKSLILVLTLLALVSLAVVPAMAETIGGIDNQALNIQTSGFYEV